MEYTIHIANVLYLLSYSMRDVLWLRILTVIAIGFLIPYFYLRSEPLMAPIYWNLLFTAINFYWIARLLNERRPVRLSDDEQRLCRLGFRTLTPREMLKLLKLAVWYEVSPGTCFVHTGDKLDRLIMIFTGKCEIRVNGRPVDCLADGQFIGEISYFTGEVADGDVIALEPTRYVCWPIEQLSGYLKRNPEMRASFQIILGRDLTRRLQRTWSHARDA